MCVGVAVAKVNHSKRVHGGKGGVGGGGGGGGNHNRRALAIRVDVHLSRDERQ